MARSSASRSVPEACGPYSATAKQRSGLAAGTASTGRLRPEGRRRLAFSIIAEAEGCALGQRREQAAHPATASVVVVSSQPLPFLSRLNIGAVSAEGGGRGQLERAERLRRPAAGRPRRAPSPPGSPRPTSPSAWIELPIEIAVGQMRRVLMQTGDEIEGAGADHEPGPVRDGEMLLACTRPRDAVVAREC